MHSLYISQHLKQECHTHFFFEYSHALELILERQCPNTGTHTVRGEWKLGISAGGRPKKSRQDPSVKKLDLQMSNSFFRGLVLGFAGKFSNVIEPKATFGFLKDVDTFRFNEKFLLRVRAGAKFTITLCQPDHRRDYSSWSNPGSNYNTDTSTVVSLYLVHPSSLEDSNVEEKKKGILKKKKYPPIELIRSGYCHSTCNNLYTYSKYKKSSVISKKEKETVEERKKKEEGEKEVPTLGRNISCAPKPPVGLPDNYPVDEYIVCAAAWRT